MTNEEEKILKEKDQVSRLKSGNVSAIVSTIKEIRRTGKVGILPVIFDLLADEPEESVYNEVLRFLNDLKEKEAVPFLVDAINNPEYKEIRKELVAACWQNNLDYHEHISTFVKVFLEDEYVVSIEAFTVIENSIGLLGENEQKAISARAKKSIPSADAGKVPLIEELIRMISTF